METDVDITQVAFGADIASRVPFCFDFYSCAANCEFFTRNYHRIAAPACCIEAGFVNCLGLAGNGRPSDVRVTGRRQRDNRRRRRQHLASRIDFDQLPILATRLSFIVSHCCCQLVRLFVARKKGIPMRSPSVEIENEIQLNHTSLYMHMRAVPAQKMCLQSVVGFNN